MRRNASIITMTILGMVLLFASCSDDSGYKSSKVTIRLTDAPALYDEVNVDIRSVAINYVGNDSTTGGWTELQTNAGIYNLLDLRNGVDTVIASEEVDLGYVSQIRLLLGANNNLVVMSDTFSLKTPSAMQTGIKINFNDSISFDNDLNILLDFDAEKSIVVKGNGEFSLSPVVSVKNREYANSEQ